MHEQGRHAGHQHGHAAALIEGSQAGIRALRLGTIGLAITAAIQLVVVAFSGSAALLADAMHNLGDVFTTVALWIALIATRRAADDRYTFGYQRFEDLAGAVIVLAIVGSGVLAIYESVSRLTGGFAPRHVVAGIAAAAVGVVGNEAVAQLKIGAGRRIGSDALVAEGQHSRLDGLVSAGAIVGLGGAAAGLWWMDSLAGIVIGVVILAVGYSSGRPILAKLVDRVDPALIERIANQACAVEPVSGVHDVRARWAGRALYVVLHITLPQDMRLDRAHDISEEVRHRVTHAVPQVVQVDVHMDPD